MINEIRQIRQCEPLIEKKEPTKVDLKKLGTKELKKIAEEKDIDTKGLKKAELVEAIESQEE